MALNDYLLSSRFAIRALAGASGTASGDSIEIFTLPVLEPS